MYTLTNASSNRFLWQGREMIELDRVTFLGSGLNRPECVLQAMGNGHCPWPVECLDPEQLIFPEIDLAAL